MNPKISTKIIKIIIIGDSGCGKTSIMQKYIDDYVVKSEGPTIGVDFRTQKIEYNGILHIVNIWDTAGQERYQSLTSAYYRMSNCVMVVFDLTDRKSFENVSSWINRSKSYDIDNSKPHILVGNKSDIAENIVSKSEIKNICEKYDIEYIEVSAYKGINISDAFSKLFLRYIETSNDDDPVIGELNIEPPNNKTCCK